MEAPQASAEAFAADSGTTPAIVTNTADQIAGLQTSAATTTSKFYTEDDLAKVRAQEKDKLYPQIESMKEELASLKKEREEKAAAKAAKQSAKEAEDAALAKAKLEDELSAKDLLKAKENEWQEQLRQEREERERAFALLERERTFADLQSYRTQRIDAERENIIPELVDLINGATKEELDSNIEALKERSARILESVTQASQSARREMVGTRTTLPAAGPLDIQSEQRNFTAEEIAAMPMNEYAKYRNRLMSDNARGVTKGLFG